MKKLMFSVVAALALITAPSARAEHKTTGTISSVQGSNLMVKTTDGKTVMVMLDAKTKITRDKTKLDVSALKVGDRIVAEGPESKDMIMATSVKLGETPKK